MIVTGMNKRVSRGTLFLYSLQNNVALITSFQLQLSNNFTLVSILYHIIEALEAKSYANLRRYVNCVVKCRGACQVGEYFLNTI